MDIPAMDLQPNDKALIEQACLDLYYTMMSFDAGGVEIEFGHGTKMTVTIEPPPFKVELNDLIV